jgi:hypothetical protein
MDGVGQNCGPTGREMSRVDLGGRRIIKKRDPILGTRFRVVGTHHLLDGGVSVLSEGSQPPSGPFPCVVEASAFKSVIRVELLGHSWLPACRTSSVSFGVFRRSRLGKQGWRIALPMLA